MACPRLNFSDGASRPCWEIGRIGTRWTTEGSKDSLLTGDITDELENAMKVVLAKVMDAFEQGDTSTEMYDHDHKRVKMEFFYEVEREESLTRWTRLSVASRCQKSDFHHFRLKGQW